MRKNSKQNLFTSTRLKLDLIASIFVFIILGSFSFVVYSLLTQDIIYQISPVFKSEQISYYINADELFQNLRDQTIFLLIVSDIIIFIVSIILFDRLVKKMLEPIEYTTNLQKKFASNLSHELRTPLSVMNMRAEIMSSKIEKAEKEEKNENDKKLLSDVKGGANIILKEISGMTTLIDDLLFEARIKYIENKPEDVTVGEILDLIQKSYETLENNKNENVVFHIDNELKLHKHIKASPTHLKRIFNNLISNSFKYTESGEVKISLSKYKNLGKKYLKIEVFDTGIGIKKEELPKISERFYRGKNVEEEFSGTGIGLSIVKGIVHANNWHFSIQSEEGKNTSIIISKIPLAEDPLE
ncbi:Sensor histidine kinase RcsC [bioreactor metagenome]|uniref:histidine kinase n=1 Tax=bioreactor metagenome TaxID=1076179 RepID=A0A644T7I6_9ZZZZ|nr:ATP-binding protein [Candidatus Elulimicrobiales bacterium]